LRDVIRAIPRVELYEQWRKAASAAIKNLVDNQTASLKFVALHLTWYNSTTSEFFSPIDASSLGAAGNSVDRIVILIDDVYDMFARLRGPQDIYSERILGYRASQLAKLAGEDYATCSEQERIEWRLEALESALSHLVAWRRAEMVQAENLARILNVDFTILGTKHTWTVLEQLAASLETPKIYLSHRISEVRRLNKSDNRLPNKLGPWDPVAKEVNVLHQEFADRKQVLINPTAIDELRFGDSSHGKSRSPHLASRWPLPNDGSGLLYEPTNEGHEYTRLLSAGLSVSNNTARSVARALASQIYFEVAFRDHIIVENTLNLCVFRPFYSGNGSAGADWSGGVRPELMHWQERRQSTASGTAATGFPRVAFVHTEQEVTDRLEWLKSNSPFLREMAETVRDHLTKSLVEEGIPDREIEKLFAGTATAELTSHLNLDPPSIVRDRASIVLACVKSAVPTALDYCFTLTKEIEDPATGQPRPDVLLLLVDETAGRRTNRLDEIAERLSLFFGGKMTESTFRSELTRFADYREREFGRVFSADPVDVFCQEMNVPLALLRQYEASV